MDRKRSLKKVVLIWSYHFANETGKPEIKLIIFVFENQNVVTDATTSGDIEEDLGDLNLIK